MTKRPSAGYRQWANRMKNIKLPPYDPRSPEYADWCGKFDPSKTKRSRVMTWTYSLQERALSDGWGLFDNSDHGLRIERNDEMARFDCDAAAQAYVALRALNGDKLAIAAWRELAWQHAVVDAAGVTL